MENQGKSAKQTAKSLCTPLVSIKSKAAALLPSKHADAHADENGAVTGGLNVAEQRKKRLRLSSSVSRSLMYLP